MSIRTPSRSRSKHFARYGVGRQLAYDEINAGRLVIKKAGRRTLIGRADAERWLERLLGKPAASGETA